MTQLLRPFVLLAVANVCVALATPRVSAQIPGPTIEELKTPDSPAFVLLGVSPNAVERPSTPKALAVSLLSAVTKGENLLPSDYAVTVAPYWLVGHSGLLAATYYNPGVSQSLRQTFAVSFATAKSTLGELPAATAGSADLGVGFRASLLEGHGSAAIETLNRKLSALRAARLALVRASDRESLSKAQSTLISGDAGLKYLTTFVDQEYEAREKVFKQREEVCKKRADLACKKQVEADKGQEEEDKTAKGEVLAQINAAWSGSIEPMVDVLPALLTALAELSSAHSPVDAQNVNLLKQEAAKGPARITARVNDLATALLTILEADAAGKMAKIAAEDHLRRGVMLSLAGGFASRVPASGVGDTELLRWGVWANPSYRLDKPLIDVVGVVRLVSRPDTIGTNALDFGGRIVHQVGSFIYSGEYVQRIEGKVVGTSRPTSERVDANVEYKIRDELYITASFGKNFAGEVGTTQSKGGLVSILGVNIGLGQKQILAVQ